MKLERSTGVGLRTIASGLNDGPSTDSKSGWPRRFRRRRYQKSRSKRIIRNTTPPMTDPTTTPTEGARTRPGFVLGKSVGLDLAVLVLEVATDVVVLPILE
jgi:hypothetical protein